MPAQIPLAINFRIYLKQRRDSRNEKASSTSGFSNRNSSSNHVPRSSKEPSAAVTNCQQLRRLLSSRWEVWRRGMAMPVGRYIAWVGTSLLALLFMADWCLPKSLPELSGDAINRPVIRIASIQQPPERIVIDTGQPTIVPSPTLVEDAVPDEPSQPLQSYASAPPPPTVVNLDQKRRKVVKSVGPKVATYQKPLASTPVAASGTSATTAPPTRLSFADIISGQLVRNLLNLH
jgi:hypothetical protein